MSLIPPPSDDEAKHLGAIGRGIEPDDQDEPDHAPAMTLRAIGKGGDGSPLGLDGFDEDGVPASTAGASITQHSAFALVAVAVIAAVVLGVMRLTMGGMHADTNAEIEGLINETLVKFEQREHMAPGDSAHAMAAHSTELADSTQVIMDITGNDAPQVPIEYVQKNPFVLGITKAQAPVADAGPKTDDAERTKVRIRQELRKLKVDMIMDGTEEKAVVINGQILKVGDTVGIFQIESIEAQKVNLRHGKYRIPLSAG